jgi:hypothetical protein
MHNSSGRILAGLACALVIVSLAAAPTAGQSGAVADKARPAPAMPRTVDGRPDLSGDYFTATITPLERPEALGNQLMLTEKEAAELEKQSLQRNQTRNSASRAERTAPPVGGNVGGYNNFWIDRERGTDVIMVDGQLRSSLIVDPPDGRIPAMTAEAQRRAAARRGAVRPTSDAPEEVTTTAQGAFDDIELRPLGERCILGFGSTSGPPSLPVLYNNHKKIVQTPQYIMILNEMVHDARIIRMNQPHRPSHLRFWMGDSIGRWEGDTLVVDTTNFTDKTRFRGSSQNLHVVERFRRVDDKTLLYQFTVEDPDTWTRAWTAEYPWNASDERLYEYACHEGNYSLQGILAGERLLDREAAEAKKSAPKP